MATRTALEIFKLKASGTNLQSAAQVTLAVDDCLIVGTGFQQSNLPDSVSWGVNELHKAASQINATSGHGAALYILRKSPVAATRYIDLDWASAIGARVAFAIKLNAGLIRDQFATSSQTASTAPSVGPTPTQDYFNDFAIGIFAAEGPSSDTAPTVSGWSTGQTDGTIGIPPVSNITIHEFYQQITGDDSAITMAGTGATSRDWASCVVTLREILVIPYLDANGTELLVGDTVEFQGTQSTISSFTRESGLPVVYCTLADGRTLYTYLVELIK